MKKALTLAARAIYDQGGQGLNLRHLVEGLREHFALTVYCAGGRIEGPGIRVIPPSRPARWLGQVPLLRRFRDVQTLLADRHFDRAVASALQPMQVFQGASGQCLASLRRASALGANTALDVVNLHIDDFYATLAASCRAFNIRPPLHRTHCQRVHAEYQEARVIRVMSRLAKSTFLERGFDPARLVVATPPMEPQPAMPGSPDVFRVAFVGLLEPWKGFHHLLESFARAAIPGSELVFWGGSGSRPVTSCLQSAMRRLPGIKIRLESVRTAGFRAVYGQSSVLVHPSLSDGHAYVVAEAMACGVPVIVTDRTGASDLVREGENGFLIAAGDVKTLARHLHTLAADAQRTRLMGARAREAVKQLTQEAFLREYVPALERLFS